MHPKHKIPARSGTDEKSLPKKSCAGKSRDGGGRRNWGDWLALDPAVQSCKVTCTSAPVFHFLRNKKMLRILTQKRRNDKHMSTHIHTTSLPACEEAPLTEGCALVWGKTATVAVSRDHIHLAGATALKSLSPEMGSASSPQQWLLLQDSHSWVFSESVDLSCHPFLTLKYYTLLLGTEQLLGHGSFSCCRS